MRGGSRRTTCYPLCMDTGRGNRSVRRFMPIRFLIVACIGSILCVVTVAMTPLAAFKMQWASMRTVSEFQEENAFSAEYGNESYSELRPNESGTFYLVTQSTQARTYTVTRVHEVEYVLHADYMSVNHGAVDDYMSAGWPFRCFEGRHRPSEPGADTNAITIRTVQSHPLQTDYSYGLPIGLQLIPLLGNFIFYALIILVPILSLRHLKFVYRRKHARCIACSYQLLESQATCPECGEMRSVDE